MIPDEPVRGRTPPPWFRSLSGLERCRAFARGQIPFPPLARLLGLRTTHVVPGAYTLVMPASEALVGGNGQLEISPLIMAALEGACMTAIEPGMDVQPVEGSVGAFRPARARPGNLIARARVVGSSNFFVFAEAQVEDPEGRHLLHGTMQAAIRRVTPTPPPVPEELPVVTEPSYEEPDPYLRSFPCAPFDKLLEQRDGLEIVQAVADGTAPMPSMQMFGFKQEVVGPGHVNVTMPASEWFCSMRGDEITATLSTLGNSGAHAAALSLTRPDHPIINLNNSLVSLKPVRPDGRPIRSQVRLAEEGDGLFVANTEIRDADDALVARYRACFMRIEASRRVRRRRKESRRMLATLLFADIVDSTRHAERLGDGRWHELLDEHRLAVRRELSRFNGKEVDTAGDGFFVWFDSPAQAVEAARAIVRAAARLDLELRTGVHTGECEMEGTGLTGIAVHIAARIQAAAAPGETLASSTVKELAAGSGLRFEDRGEHELKGVPEPWRLYAAAGAGE